MWFMSKYVSAFFSLCQISFFYNAQGYCLHSVWDGNWCVRINSNETVWPHVTGATVLVKMVRHRKLDRVKPSEWSYSPIKQWYTIQLPQTMTHLNTPKWQSFNLNLNDVAIVMYFICLKQKCRQNDSLMLTCLRIVIQLFTKRCTFTHFLKTTRQLHRKWAISKNQGWRPKLLFVL